MQSPKFFIQFSAFSIVTIFILLFSCKKDDGEEENSISKISLHPHSTIGFLQK